tara:strand:- start:92 stop:298 length:207 start_codon:yes stop_codon:yes gene_type:complete
MIGLIKTSTSKQVVSAFFIIVFFGLALGCVGEMDKVDEEGEVQHYCEMVEAGHWGNFKSVKLDEYCNG